MLRTSQGYMYKPYRQGTIGEADQWQEVVNPVNVEAMVGARYKLEPASAHTTCCDLAMARVQADRCSKGTNGEADLWREAVNPIRREGLR